MTRRRYILERISLCERRIGAYRAEIESLREELLKLPPEVLDLENQVSQEKQLRYAERRRKREEGS